MLYKNHIKSLYDSGQIDFTHIKLNDTGKKDILLKEFIKWHIEMGFQYVQKYEIPSGALGLFIKKL